MICTDGCDIKLFFVPLIGIVSRDRTALPLALNVRDRLGEQERAVCCADRHYPSRGVGGWSLVVDRRKSKYNHIPLNRSISIQFVIWHVT